MKTLLLVVEDDALVAMPLEEALLEAGFDVRMASSGEAAIAILEEDQTEIRGLITDIRLGGEITGWKVARRARELIPHIPVIYASADSATAWEIEGVPKSIMISKPYALIQITTAMAQLLNDASPSDSVSTGD